MKLMNSFRTLTTISASGSSAGFPAANIALLDPGITWKADTFPNPAGAWLKVDFGSAQSVAGLFLNNANFTTATWQGNATDSWTSPSFSQALTNATDKAGKTKGFFSPTVAFNYRYLRLFIPYQALISGSLPTLGNLIAGATVVEPRASAWAPATLTAFATFHADGGTYSKTRKGIKRHVITVSFNGSLAETETWLGTFDDAVIFSDLGNPADSYLVYFPDSIRPSLKSTLDVTVDMAFEERV